MSGAFFRNGVVAWPPSHPFYGTLNQSALSMEDPYSPLEEVMTETDRKSMLLGGTFHRNANAMQLPIL